MATEDTQIVEQRWCGDCRFRYDLDSICCVDPPTPAFVNGRPASWRPNVYGTTPACSRFESKYLVWQVEPPQE